MSISRVKREPSRQIFEKSSKVIFNENPSGGNGVVPCRHTDMMKLIVAFRNFANAPANSSLCTHLPFLCCSLYAYISTADGDNPLVAK